MKMQISGLAGDRLGQGLGIEMEVVVKVEPHWVLPTWKWKVRGRVERWVLRGFVLNWDE